MIFGLAQHSIARGRHRVQKYISKDYLEKKMKCFFCSMTE